MDLSAALEVYDRVALNLDKLDRVWQRMRDLVPEGPFLAGGSDDEVLYGELAQSWKDIAASLPAIDGWRLEVEVVDYGAIGQARVDYLEIDEPLGLHAFEAQVAAPGTEAARYRQRLARARQRLVRKRAADLVREVDGLLEPVPTDPETLLTEVETAPVVDTLRVVVAEIERLLGEALTGGPRQHDLHRHLRFGEPHDLRDIAVFDWPAFRPHVELALYGDEAPVPVEVDDLAVLAGATASSVPSVVHWERVDADGFERLLARLLEHAGTYTNINRPMNVNAADAGRDIEAFRRVSDGLAAERLERVIVQAKHWPGRGINSSDIADLVHAKLPLWEGEPIRGLIVATTGSFTQDAVRWVEQHNREARRPDITIWSSAELEALLRKWPAILAEFGLLG
ncbi:restriction endonuclease [Saccharothrix sp. Mg75]|uniref:restriction endonuclease n=1 Tax=Saccharothrix sp. Mg75 TaxID=3445357 RepID=UPI003EEB6045